MTTGWKSRESNFEVVESRRRSSRSRNMFQPTEDPIPLLGNKPDKELESLLKDRGGIVTNITDDNIGTRKNDRPY
jgi:hypothetical protein